MSSLARSSSCSSKTLFNEPSLSSCTHLPKWLEGIKSSNNVLLYSESDGYSTSLDQKYSHRLSASTSFARGAPTVSENCMSSTVRSILLRADEHSPQDALPQDVLPRKCPESWGSG